MVRRTTVATALALFVALGAASGTSTHAVADIGPDYIFVSTPDLLNTDVADVTSSPYWQPGMPNSTNRYYKAGLTVFLDDLAAQGATDVLVAGDLVEGRWGFDSHDTGVFGPVDTRAHRQSAIRLAAREYYPTYKQRFKTRNLNLLPAVGDHDIGDNPWPAGGFKYDQVPMRKELFARYFTANGTRFADHPTGQHAATAYAVQLAPEVLLITLDEFHRTSAGIQSQLGQAQLDWLRATLAEANTRGVDWIIVQGHLPVLQPVRFRHSSNLSFDGGEASGLWRAMVAADVDLYLNGEVHDNTTITPETGPVQISHGGLFHYGQAVYMTGKVYGERLDLEIRGFETTVVPSDRFLWQTDRRANWQPVYNPGSFGIGSMSLTKDGEVLSRDGVMAPYEVTP